MLGNLPETTANAFGKHVAIYDGGALITVNLVINFQTQGAAAPAKHLRAALRHGGVMGLHNGQLQIAEMGDLETTDASLWRGHVVQGSGTCRVRCLLQCVPGLVSFAATNGN
jgi:hypothetical protein